MKKLKTLEGKLDKDFNYKTLLKKMDTSKYISSKAIILTDEDIKRIIESPKVSVGELGIGDELLSINEEFAKLNDFDSTEFSFCEKNIQLFLIQNEIDGEIVTETCAISTYRNGDSYSIGLYYIPNGNIKDICLVERVCDHNGNNEHKNKLNDEVISPYETHIHKQSEAFENWACEKYKDNEEKLILALQTPDAEKIEKLENIKEMENYIFNRYNVVFERVSSMVEDKPKNKVKIKDGHIVSIEKQKTLLEDIQDEMKKILEGRKKSYEIK